ncbi:MAG: alpha/beta hydrolase [Pseudomonadota bacterium]
MFEAGHAPAVALPPGGVAWEDGLAITASDGVALRAALWNPGGARGLALYLPGRTEFLEKASATAASLVERGFAVASVDWRGQGLSARSLDESRKGHVERFDDFGLDLAALLAAPPVVRQGPVRLVLGHSMGSAISLGAVARGQIAPAALVLSAPMAGIAFNPAQNLGVKLVAKIACALGLGDRWPPTDTAGQPSVFEPFETNCITHDQEIYAWQAEALRAAPGLQLGLPTFRWIAAAYDAMALMARLGPPGFPVQVLLGEKEAVVDNAASRRMAERLGASVVEIAGAKHDILMEDASRRAAVWRAVDGFLAETGV